MGLLNKDIYGKIPEIWHGHKVYWFDIDVLVPRVIQPFNQKLAESIEKEGMLNPLIMGKVDAKGNILVGNQRYTILTKLGVKKVPIVCFNDLHFKKFIKKRGRYRHGNPKKYNKLFRKQLNAEIREQFFVDK